jgi:hypothetical protein
MRNISTFQQRYRTDGRRMLSSIIRLFRTPTGRLQPGKLDLAAAPSHTQPVTPRLDTGLPFSLPRTRVRKFRKFVRVTPNRARLCHKPPTRSTSHFYPKLPLRPWIYSEAPLHNSRNSTRRRPTGCTATGKQSSQTFNPKSTASLPKPYFVPKFINPPNSTRNRVRKFRKFIRVAPYRARLCHEPPARSDSHFFPKLPLRPWIYSEPPLHNSRNRHQDGQDVRTMQLSPKFRFPPFRPSVGPTPLVLH